MDIATMPIVGLAGGSWRLERVMPAGVRDIAGCE